MTKLGAWIGLAAGCLAVAGAAGQERDDRDLIARAASERGQPTAATAAAPSEKAPAPTIVAKSNGAETISPEVRNARIEVALAQIKLDLVEARTAVKGKKWTEAARHALVAQRLIQQLPKDVDSTVWDLEAEGVLAKAQREGVKLESLRPTPKVAGASAAHQQSQPGANVQPPPTAAPAGGSVAVVPAVPVGASQTPAPATNSATTDAKPAGSTAVVFEVETQEEADEARLQYEARLYDAYRAAEVRGLIEADEARVTPAGEIGYSADWPQIVQRRAKYAGGEIAKSDSWQDKDGKQWYAAIYDIRDLTYEVPDFAPALTGDITEDLRNTLDRDALRNGSMIFNGYAEDLAAGIPLLNFFGGVDDMAYRGPKYSIEKQKQIMEQIRAFTTPSTEAKIIPLGSP